MSHSQNGLKTGAFICLDILNVITRKINPCIAIPAERETHEMDKKECKTEHLVESSKNKTAHEEHADTLAEAVAHDKAELDDRCVCFSALCMH